jgi:hypothetical protein
MKITIKRTELVTYCTTVEVADEEAQKLLDSPTEHERRLSELCPATDDNWMDAGDAEYETEEEMD